MKTNSGGIQGLASEGHPEINYPIELLKRVYGDQLRAFPMTDPMLFMLLFQAHSNPWFDLAVRHVERCFEHCVKFLRSLLVAVLTEDFRILPARLFHRYLLKPLEHLHSQALHELKQIEKDRMRSSNTQSEVSTEELVQFREERSSRKLFDFTREIGDPNVETSMQTSDVARFKWRQNEAQELIEEMLVYYRVSKYRK
jgi:hypothetical protein